VRTSSKSVPGGMQTEAHLYTHSHICILTHTSVYTLTHLYTHSHICIHTHTHTCISTYVCTGVCVRFFVYTYMLLSQSCRVHADNARLQTFSYTHVYTHVCMNVCVYTCISICMYIYMQTMSGDTHPHPCLHKHKKANV